MASMVRGDSNSTSPFAAEIEQAARPVDDGLVGHEPLLRKIGEAQRLAGFDDAARKDKV